MSRDQQGLLHPSLQTQIEFHPAICTDAHPHTHHNTHHNTSAISPGMRPKQAVSLAGSGSGGIDPRATPTSFSKHSPSQFTRHWREFPCFDIAKSTEAQSLVHCLVPRVPWTRQGISTLGGIQDALLSTNLVALTCHSKQRAHFWQTDNPSGDGAKMLLPEAKKLTSSIIQQCPRKLLFSAPHDLILSSNQIQIQDQPNLFNNIPVPAPTLVASWAGEQG